MIRAWRWRYSASQAASWRRRSRIVCRRSGSATSRTTTTSKARPISGMASAYHPPRPALPALPPATYDPRTMRALLFLLLAGALAPRPFPLLRQPWAVRLWRRARLVAIIYAVVILVSAIVALVLRWDDIYG